MNRKRLTLLLGIFLAVAFSPAFASDPPHWTGENIGDFDCTTSCHLPHGGEGGTLTQAAGNVNLCQSCHAAGGLAASLPINSVDRAVPGVGGTSHAFDVAAVHPTYNTRIPVDNPEMEKRIYPETGERKIVCSTCHNQHSAAKASGGRPRISPATQTQGTPKGDLVTSGGSYTGDVGVWYRIRIFQLSPDQFQYSKDGTPGGPNDGTWFGPVGFTAGSEATIPDGFGVTVTILTGVEVGDVWEFSASYPFIRGKLDSATSTFCRDCHNAWNMTDVSTYNNGNPTSHPVGVAYPAGTAGYRSEPLDGDGSVSPAQDSNPTNDLKLEGGTNVQCLTCHGIHFVDSNTQTVDGQ